MADPRVMGFVVVVLVGLVGPPAAAKSPPTTSQVPPGPARFEVIVPPGAPIIRVTARSITPCPRPREDLDRAPRARYLVQISTASGEPVAQVAVPLNGGSWQTDLIAEWFSEADTFDIHAQCQAWVGDKVNAVPRTYAPVTVTVSLAAGTASPAPTEVARPQLTG
jgi:hypothetical protein